MAFYGSKTKKETLCTGSHYHDNIRKNRLALTFDTLIFIRDYISLEKLVSSETTSVDRHIIFEGHVF